MILPLLCSLRPRWLAVAFVAASMACANAHEPARTDRVHGVILVPILSSLSIIAPQPVRVGVPVDVTIRTFGSSTCARPAGMDVTHSGSEVLFVPWVTSGAQSACTDDLASHQHVASVTFTQPGTARLVAFGYKVDFQGGRSLGTVAVSITVTP
ncbi:MAG: hypothetical protein H7066_07970 [Cytophagaceae bacterium]|nr:hypothetical protein [Gemmatimonadaceae bacterium]